MSLIKFIPDTILSYNGVASFGEEGLYLLDLDFKEYIDEFGHNVYHDSGDIDVEYLSDLFNEYMLVGME